MWLTVNYAKEQRGTVGNRTLTLSHTRRHQCSWGVGHKLEQAFQSPAQKYDFNLLFVHTHTRTHITYVTRVSLTAKFHPTLSNTEAQMEIWIYTYLIATGQTMVRQVTLVHRKVKPLT
jgi:hypothetical protein